MQYDNQIMEDIFIIYASPNNLVSDQLEQFVIRIDTS